MGAERDDEDSDALTWAGDDERGRDVDTGPRRRAAKRARAGAGVDDSDDADAAEPDDGAGPADAAADALPPATSGLTLVSYGILAGVYGIFTIGWIVSVLGSGTTLGSLPAEIMYQFGEFLAIALPALWFVAVLRLATRPSRRLLWLLAGIPLVLPWPWVLGQ